jgi:tetratricopeptide (TPR) repeat protein
VHVQPLVLDLLLLLLQHRGQVVSEDVLRRRLWSEVQVTDASLRRLVKEARRAIGDDGEAQRFIETIRGRGLRFATPVAVEAGWDTSFVGRADALEALERKLEEVAGGMGGLTLLHGPAGIGKTRLLAEIEARAGLRGFRVLHGSGRAEAEGDAFHPWLDVARQLGIDALLPGAAAADAATHSSDALSAHARRYESFRTIARTLAQSARARPIAIGLDDLQLADADGLEALRFLSPALAGAPVWILGAYRTGTGPRTEYALGLLAALAAETSTQDLPLRGLEAGELRSLVRNQLRAELGESLAALLAGRAGGNPLFALEIARSLQRDGHPLEAEPHPEIEAKLAQGIAPLLARRLSAIPEHALRLLRAGSALGNPFDTAIVEAAEGIAPADAERWLDECATAGLVERSGRGAWRFGHPLIAEAVYARLEAEGPTAAPAQHVRIAEACRRVGVGDPFVLARQYLKAGSAGDPPTALAHIRAAAREALERAALADAQLWYREAVALADASGAALPVLHDLLMEQGTATMPLVDVEAARVSFDRAAQLALATDDRRRLASAALAYAHRPFPLAASPRIVHWLRAARESPCDDAGLRARVASRLGSELFYMGAQAAAESRACIAEGLALAREAGDPATLGPVLLDVSATEFSARNPRAWLAIAEEIERTGRASGDREIEFRGLHSRATGWLELGERDRVEGIHQACRSLVRTHLTMYAAAVTRGIEVMLALLDGRWSDARSELRKAERDLLGMSSGGLALLVGVQRTLLALEEGRAASTLPGLDALVTRSPLPGLMAFAGVIHASTGNTERARSSLASVVAGLPGLPFDRSRLPALVFAAEIAHRVGDPEAAKVLTAELTPFAGVSAVIGNASAYLGSVEQALGWTAAARGEARAAVEHFQRALRVHEALRSPPWCARSERAIAEMRRLRLVRDSG